MTHRRTSGQIANFRGRFGDFVYNTDTGELMFCDGATIGCVAIGSGDGGGLPVGGTDGQVLTKQSSSNGDADWEDAASGGINQAAAVLWGEL